MQLYLIKFNDFRDFINRDILFLNSKTETSHDEKNFREDSQWSRILSRHFLQHLLHKTFSEKKLDLNFSKNKHGKPFIPAHPEINFNISHSENYLIIGISAHGPIGVDAEFLLQKCEQHLKIAKKYFCAAEYNAIVKSENPKLEFIRIWTVKEALYKALGLGLLKSLSDTEVSLGQRSSISFVKNGAGCRNLNLLCLEHDDHCVTMVSLNQPQEFSVSLVASDLTTIPLRYRTVCSLRQDYALAVESFDGG